ncbi:polysaccharide pyruvyl transferase family protein [Desertimonas flava]|uniref:polysaccharide pyruvyl transferase family protein n=1 Tax=Desertimonas flava TaxID=2064846 RepID=UPI000E347B2B|nr:polysaccharide pyruvyl transferase family protein [Desertimonas flava]
MSRARVLLVGAFGQGNPGDESLCAAFVHALGDHELLVASADPDETAGRHGVATIAATALPVARALSAVDAVVVAGGTIFKRLHRSSGRRPTALLRNTAALMLAARTRGRPVALVGVGAGDLHGPAAARLSAWITRHADLLILRDEESAAVLTDAGVPSPFWIGADPVWALADGVATFGRSPAAPAPADRSVVAVALSHLAGDAAFERNLAAGLDGLGGDWLIRLQPWQTGAGSDADLRLARRLADRIPGAVIDDPPHDVGNAAAHLSDQSVDVVLGLRFHALVAAGLSNRRFVAVAHEPKLAGVARRLDQLSVPPHASGEVYTAAVTGALRRPPPTAAAVRGEAAAAATAFDLLRLLLADGELAEPATLSALPLSAGARSW